MAKSSKHRKRQYRSNPRGLIQISSRGFGFVQTAEGEFFIPASKTNAAFDGDLVEIATLPQGKRGNRRHSHGPSREGAHAGNPVARVVRIIEHAHDTIIGRYEISEPFGIVVPEDSRIHHDIFTLLKDNPDIPDGSMVRVRIRTYPDRHTAATGVVEEVLGDEEDEFLPIQVIIDRYDLETQFSEAALKEARGAKLGITEALSCGYRDLRNRLIFTIDPVDARDFDDALSVERVKRNNRDVLRLGIHIADVSAYVPWSSAPDLNARRRATSVYLVDRVVPMLPEELSAGLCSLKPNEDRLAFTVDIFIDDEARLLDYEIYESVIKSSARLTYDYVEAVLRADKKDEMPHADEFPNVEINREVKEQDLREQFFSLQHIAHKRIKTRNIAGGLDFESREAKVQLDKAGHPLGIAIRLRTEATSLVEEAMIFANETVAQHLKNANWPAIYRVHDAPRPDSLEALMPILEEFSWFRHINKQAFMVGEPHAIQAVLALSREKPEGELVSTLVLRSMKRATYEPYCDLHFGLASPAYLHFTSPIRRYPDLMVHRMLKAQLVKRPEKFSQEVKELGPIAQHSSEMELIAEKAAFESQEVKIIEYMASFIGKTFPAVISGVATYGIYVRLENTAEGLVSTQDLGHEYFALDALRYCLVGQDSGKVYRLGGRVEVILKSADYRRRELNFSLKSIDS